MEPAIREMKAHFELLKNQFVADLAAEIAKAELDHSRRVFELENKVQAFSREALSKLDKEVGDHRAFLAGLESTRNSRTVIFGGCAVVVIGAVLTFALNGIFAQFKERAALFETEVLARMNRVAEDKVSTEGLVRQTKELLIRDIAIELGEQTATSVLAQLGHAKSEVEKAAQQVATPGALLPEHARNLLYIIDGLMVRYSEPNTIGSTSSRREALMLTASGISDLAHGSAFSAEYLFNAAIKRDWTLPDPYVLLAFLHTRDYAYLGGGKWNVFNRERQMEVLGRVMKLSLADETKKEFSEHLGAQHAIARYKKESGDLSGAIHVLESAVAKHHHPASYRLLSAYLWVSGNKRDAIQNAFYAWQRDPTYTQGINNLVFMLTHDGNERERCSIQNAVDFWGEASARKELENLTRTMAAHRAASSYHVYADTLAQAWFTLWLDAVGKDHVGDPDKGRGRATEFAERCKSSATELLNNTMDEPLFSKTEKYERKREQQILQRIDGQVMSGEFN